MSKTAKIALFIIIFAAAGVFFLLNAAGNSLTPTSSTPATTPHSAPTIEAAPDTQDIFTLVNNERIKAGLPALTANPTLDATANAKCQHLIAENFYGHFEPDGTTPWIIMHAHGITYAHAAENLNHGDHRSQRVVESWMQSPPHRAAILDPRYTQVGTAVCHSDNYMTFGAEYIEVQHFIGY
jgi:uncharacterized protein YkwD